jgi:uncharacterized repeat protein (TIGR01451 family)
VASTTLQSVLDYDARDKVASFKPISLTKTSFPASTNTLLAGCVEVFEQGLWGTEYRVPVGVDMPTSTATSTLAYDADIFGYTALSIMAGAKGATVQIDADNNGSYEQTVTLAEGENSYLTGVNTGGRVVSDNPVQVILFSGRPGSRYQSRDTSLLPTYRWSTSYYAPVSTSSTYGTSVFLYNPGASDITVNYDYRTSATAYATATVSVPAGGNARVDLSPNDNSTNFGAYHFHTTGSAPPVFYAFCAVDGTSATVASNQAFDGGFTLVGRPSLTTQVLVSLGIGRDPYSATGLTQNGNPVWLTTVGNGHTPETIYVDYNGDNAGPLTDPNGNQYDVAYSLRELEQQKIFDPDGDQSGMLVYSLNSSVKLAAAWAQDPTIASTAQPGLDVSTLLPPLREGEAAKKSELSLDADGDGYVSAGDTLEYDIRAVNSARAAIPGPFAVQDTLPADVAYVPGTTRYRYSVGGSWQAWVSIPDDGSGTAFPLDGGGFSVPGNLGTGQQLQVVFKAVIADHASLSGPAITNSGFVEISPYGLVLPIEWKDVIYGSIGDRVWNDQDGDGVQDGGEAGIPGIDVFADANGNGVWDAGEPKDTTDANGNYLLAGLVAGTYTVRVDAADVSAVNVGYGPSHDLDGVSTSHVATVALAGAQDRVDADFGYRVGASVGDRVWVDLDADGVQEAGEPGINGVRVYLDLDNDNAYDAGEPNTVTSVDGSYYIGNLDSGTYTVRVDTGTLPAGVTQTFDPDGGLDHESAVTLIAAEHRGDLDFGYRGTLSIGNLVWEDVDSNGSVSISEAGIPNVRVFIDIDQDGAFDSTEPSAVTDASGSYSIGNLYDGSHTVRIDTSTLPASYVQTYDLVSPVSDHMATVTLSGASRTDVDFGYRNDATIGDLVWNDRNANGIRDTGEQGIEGVLVYIDADNDNLFDQGVERFAITDVTGFYEISNLAAGTYAVRVEISTLPQGSSQTYDLDGVVTSHEVARTLSVSENATDVDFGYRANAAFGDFVWNDIDADGIQDGGESGISGVRIYADINGNGVFDSAAEPAALTDSSGAYTIGNLVPGTYTARVDVSTLPPGVVQTFDAVGTLDHAATFFVSANQSRADIDFGYTQHVTIGDLVWNDLDADGQKDPGEPGLGGVSVTAYNASNDTVAATAVTDSNGAYTFGGLLPGTYYVVFDRPVGYNSSPSDTGADASDSDADMLTGRTPNLTLTGGQSNLTLDAGFYQSGTVSGHLYIDTNGDGNQDPGEPDLADVNVIVTDSNGNPQTVVTDPDGNWTATVPPGNTSSKVDETDPEYPAGYTQTEGTDPGVVSAVANTNTDAGIDGYYIPGSISGTVLADTDDDGDGDVPLEGVLLRLLDGLGNPVLDGLGQPVTTLTLAGGTYLFTNVIPGEYCVAQDQPSNFASVSDTDGPNDNVIGNVNPILVTGGQNNAGNDFVEIELGLVSGYVLADSDDNGSGDTPLPGVFLKLLDGSGNPVLDGLGVPIQVATDTNGFYSFTQLSTGTYQVSEIQPSGFASVSDVDGGDPDVIGNLSPITILPGGEITHRDFVEIELGAISGYVYAGSVPLSGVTLTLLDENGDPVDGDPDTPGVQPITTVTSSLGYYSFPGVVPGTYQVAQAQPVGYDSVGDIDGGNPDIIGDVIPITVAPGEHSEENNFLETDVCPDDWAQWKLQHPDEEADGNPDADSYDNLAEFAFAMPAGDGTGSPWLGNTAWIIRQAPLDPDTLEGVFIRPKGAPLNVTYTLQYAASAGNPTAWQSIVITPLMITTSDNGDCTETVTIHDLEALTGLTGGTGTVRIKVDLDEEPPTGTDHTSYSEVEGWKETLLEFCCRTYNNPYLRETAFTGTVGGVSGQDLTFTVSGGSADLSTLLASGSFYLEVTSGDNEGHRFDIVSAVGNTVTLADDANLHAAAAPFNTLLGPPPASLAGDMIVIRRHWTLNELFPPSVFGATDDRTTADQVQMFAAGAWVIYWLYDDGILPARWVRTGDNTYADQGAAVLAPGQGMFFNNRTAAIPILAYGEIRPNDFVRPLAAGNNLIGGGYPVDQSATGNNSRAMSLAAGFFGSRDFATADSFFLWKGDAAAGASGYDTFYLLNNAPKVPLVQRWVKVGDASLLARDAELLLLGERSVFLRAKDALDGYTVPSPWTP